MALDLRHGIYVRKNNANNFFGCKTTAISPALAFRVGGAIKYVPLATSGSGLAVRKNGTTYYLSKPSSVMQIVGNYMNNIKRWNTLLVRIDSSKYDLLAENASITVRMLNSGGSVLATKTVTLNANTDYATNNPQMTLSASPSRVTATVSVFGKTYTGSVAFTNGAFNFNITLQ